MYIRFKLDTANFPDCNIADGKATIDFGRDLAPPSVFLARLRRSLRSCRSDFNLAFPFRVEQFSIFEKLVSTIIQKYIIEDK